MEYQLKFYGGYKSEKLVTRFWERSWCEWSDPKVLIAKFSAPFWGRLHRKIFSSIFASFPRVFPADLRPTLPRTFRWFCAENAARHVAEISGKFRRNFFEKISKIFSRDFSAKFSFFFFSIFFSKFFSAFIFPREKGLFQKNFSPSAKRRASGP